MDPRAQNMADVLVQYCTGVKQGDWVVVMTTIAGEPLANACARAIARAGGHPTVQFNSELIGETVIREASEEQLAYVSPATRAIYERMDVLINLLAPVNTRAMAGIDPQKLAYRQKAQEWLFEIYMKRASTGDLRWVIAQFPTPAAAQDAGMSLPDYEDFVYRAGLLDTPDPVAAWHSLGERNQRLVEWLQGKEEVHVVGPGTDLCVNVADRLWINDDGHLNFPGGEVFTGPREDGVNGTIQFNFPGFLNGREVNGICLTFKDGTVTDASSTSDQAFLREMLDVDPGARRLGEFAIGTNPGVQRFTKNTLFDEKIGGTIHMALGRSITETGGVNESAIHWDVVYNLRNGAELYVDGELLSRNGEFQIEGLR